ncbi:sugar phosphate isomerase/epimerase family protein [Paenibacillus sp. Soil724D2]|uniref:sugar phosphate isomerase/epimerase family protein n=1 Tax=Paenibacillus sp. (strain Soil724D2) TaxID=1736392 RepID=UPI0007141DA5|nr:sugar phosphate isomerase/epimerase family protein [Paenibacillus sp. Soil724D2]KRE36472.1 xylose isomerase [Paenibacillus sp. Soil724D2]
MIWNRLGVITDEVSPSLVEALNWVSDQGLKHVEIRMVDGVNILHLNDQQIERVRDEVASRGLYVSAVSSPLFKCALDSNRPVASGDKFGNPDETVETHMDWLPRAFHIARTLGTKRIRIFSFWREDEPERYTAEIVGHLSLAAAEAEREDMLLLLENEHSCNGGYASEVARIVREVNSPALRVLWDPGNEERWSPSYPDGYEHVRDLIDHFHLKYWYVAKGQDPLLYQLTALNRDGYSGLYTIETHYVPDGGTRMDGTHLTLMKLKEQIEKWQLT